ncbi:hypothetical protein AB6A40_004806 [Gnathostoma spinigerum]|uniref:PDZ domain-containing protein n=1 Tax=Gnathostoma spinigerum TaxID=75299 RepID=A0ABD6ENH1_9BILA
MECLLQQNGRTSSRSSNDAWTPTFLSGKLMNLPNLSLPALSLVEARKRTITLHRNVAGDFGFRFRRTQYLVGNGEIRTVVLAEPLEMKCGPPRPNDIVSGLLPGDQLLAINNVPIDKVGREELPSIIQELITSTSRKWVLCLKEDCFKLSNS